MRFHSLLRQFNISRILFFYYQLTDVENRLHGREENLKKKRELIKSMKSNMEQCITECVVSKAIQSKLHEEIQLLNIQVITIDSYLIVF